MTKKKSFKIKGDSTMEQLLNFESTKEESTSKQGAMETYPNENTIDINEVDQATRQAIESKLEKRDKKVLILVKESTHEKLKEQAWLNHKSVNAYINDLLEKGLKEAKGD